MKFLDLALLRRSVRSYTREGVERAQIEMCIEAARISPSSNNSQPWHFIVVDDTETRVKLAGLTSLPPSKMNRFAANAPVLVVLVLRRPTIAIAAARMVKGIDYNLIDAGIAATHFCLQASELGLGTCMIGWFDQSAVKRLLGIHRADRVALLIAVGHPVSGDVTTMTDKRRKPLEAIRSFGRFE